MPSAAADASEDEIPKLPEPKHVDEHVDDALQWRDSDEWDEEAAPVPAVARAKQIDRESQLDGTHCQHVCQQDEEDNDDDVVDLLHHSFLGGVGCCCYLVRASLEAVNGVGLGAQQDSHLEVEQHVEDDEVRVRIEAISNVTAPLFLLAGKQ